MYCNECGKPTEINDHYCNSCGKKQEKPDNPPTSSVASTSPKKGLDLKWVFKSSGIYFLLTTAIYTIAFILYKGIQIPSSSELPLLALCNIIIFFTGGLITAYYSPGITLKEPALALSIIVTVVNLVSLAFINMPFSFIGHIMPLTIAWLLPFGIAYAGAKVGEKLQAKIKVKT